MSAPSEADLRRIFERSPIGLYRSTSDGRFLYVNPALVAMLGYDSPVELLAVDIAHQLYVDPQARGPLVERYLSAGVVGGVDVTWRRKDGLPIEVRLYGHAVTGDDGEAAGFDVQVIDMTPLREAEAQLRVQRAETLRALTKLRSVMAQLPVVVWTVDPDLRFTSIEGTAWWPAPALVGRPLAEVLGEVGDGRELAMHRRALAGESASFETERDDKLWLVTVGPLRDGDGGIAGVTGTAIDVTMMRRLERNVQHTQRIESLGVLAGGVAHDFNNLLVSILGNADLALREGVSEPAARRAIEALRTASLRAAELTQQLLTYSGRGEIEVTRVALGPLIAEMVTLLTPRRGAVRVELAEAAPPVRADPAQVRQVVMNLLTNAFDAVTAVGGGEVRLCTREEVLTGDPHPFDVVTAAPGRYVAIEVGDQGVGMDVATRRKIFDPFYTTKPSGHGLGLAAVLGIVRGHRGGLRLHSRPGAGTTFEVLLPVAVAAAPAVAARAAGKTVMVVDDEEMVREVLCHMIEDLGYAAIGAACGRDALGLLDGGARAIDAAIVDLTMPRMNGRAVVEGLRARQPALPVSLTSGRDDEGAVGEAAAFLRKPFRIETLEEVLRDVLGPPR
jgi:two-component system, cell cycle sensor histidine kinase and response regulator CckA